MGFGDLTGEFWYGLRSLYHLTKLRDWEMRIDFTFSNGTKSHLQYAYFRLSSRMYNHI